MQRWLVEAESSVRCVFSRCLKVSSVLDSLIAEVICRCRKLKACLLKLVVKDSEWLNGHCAMVIMGVEGVWGKVAGWLTDLCML